MKRMEEMMTILQNSNLEEVSQRSKGQRLDVVFCLPKYINNKIITRNSTNLCRIGLY
jgi:hypothetical protein